MCKRWRQLVDSPPLLRDISVFLEAINPLEDALVDSDSPILHDWYSHDPDQPIQHVLECFRWLRKHAAQHVQRLAIELGQLVVEQEYENQEVVIDVMRNALRACTQLQVGCALRAVARALFFWEAVAGGNCCAAHICQAASAAHSHHWQQCSISPTRSPPLPLVSTCRSPCSPTLSCTWPKTWRPQRGHRCAA